MKIDIVALNAEISACKRVQSWSPLSTRSSWWPALEAIRDASSENELAAAIEFADTEAVRLATIVATRIAIDADGLRDDLLSEVWHTEELVGIDESENRYDELNAATTVQGLVAIAIRHGIAVDDSRYCARDGLVIDHHTGQYYAYASLREFDGGVRSGSVEVPLLALTWDSVRGLWCHPDGAPATADEVAAAGKDAGLRDT